MVFVATTAYLAKNERCMSDYRVYASARTRATITGRLFWRNKPLLHASIFVSSAGSPMLPPKFQIVRGHTP